MVLSSAAASTQTTILPTARTTLSMATYKALPPSFAKMHPRYLTPTVSTLVMGGISIVLYAAMNYLSGGNVIDDAVTALRRLHRVLLRADRLRLRLVLPQEPDQQRAQPVDAGHPAAGSAALILWFLGGCSLWQDYDVATANNYTMWTVPGLHWQIGGVFVIAFVSALIGLIFFIYLRITSRAFFKRQTLTRATPTLVPDE